MRRAVGLVSLLAVASCDVLSGRASLGPPARLIVGKSDTVLVNSRAPVQLPVRVLDSAGHDLKATELRYARVAGDTLPVSGMGRVTCARRGNAEVRVSLGALEKQFVLLCRPVKGFRFVYDDLIPLVSGGPSRALHLDAVGVDGEPVDALAATVTVEDSSVAVLHGLTVEPRKPGNTGIEFDLGDCIWASGATVHEPVSDPTALRTSGQTFLVPSLRLAAGEYRSWRLPRGEYRVGLVESRPPAEAKLLVERTAMNCVRWMGIEQQFHCVALEGASLIVRNPLPPSAGGELTGTLFVVLMEPLVATPAPSRVERQRAPAKRFCPMLR